MNTALKNVLGYRLYRDLKRGWRVTSLNLEQCGLLKIEYLALKEVCSEEAVWQDCHPALRTVSKETKLKICQTLLDFLRRELAIDADELNLEQQGILRRQSKALLPPWELVDSEKMYYSSIAYPRSRRATNSRKV